MALSDDLNQLALQEVVYLTRILSGQGVTSTTIFRGRLHQALSGNWVFNTSTGQNGVAGINLGQPTTTWSSTNNPKTGLQVTLSNQILPIAVTQLNEFIAITNVIPEDLAD